ncbi:hypothetical protein M3P05_13770 [Sansalvadorimonas sp. 2012CJ34-2]|uniref:Uncharacterized protein n=1 Tax=Parendozoicomonas callyspongiae TaxID=2942213 RepID=A0ABT0PHW8_9GAMM|nr:hypothetical protein [Sansalvadorimonas sp. 2012CJ34-2]MCL6270994.1 hypothetical protein [Sansalvadorimonas sp. 2012CJ34-2]
MPIGAINIDLYHCFKQLDADEKEFKHFQDFYAVFWCISVIFVRENILFYPE